MIDLVTHDNLIKKQSEAPSSLSTREELIITETDKDGSTIMWGINKNLKKVNDQLNKEELYHELRTSPFEYHQNCIKNSLDDMVGKNLIAKETSEILKPINTSGSLTSLWYNKTNQICRLLQQYLRNLPMKNRKIMMQVLRIARISAND